MMPTPNPPVALLEVRNCRQSYHKDATADLVVLEADHQVRDVLARGVWHRRDGKTVRRGTFEPA